MRDVNESTAPVSDGVAPPPHRLSASSKAWRLVVTAAAFGALTLGQIHDTNDYWPLGSLSQFATGSNPNGQVRSLYMLADTTDGEQVRVPLNPRGVGVGRAEIEYQLDRILADPSLLQSIADAQEALHPDRAAYTKLYVMRDVYQLVDGVRAGELETEELTTWEVQP
jgi:hypothetical protein